MNCLQRYGNWCGWKSFTFQCLFLGWTFLIACFALLVFIGNADADPNNEEEMLTIGMAGLCCPFATWLLFAVPLVILAIVTIKEKSN